MSPVALPERLTRDALVLRLWAPDDVADLGAAVNANLDHLRPYMPWVADEPLPPARRLELIRGWRERFDVGTDATYGIWLDGAVAGGCGLHQRLGRGGLEIGYWVAGPLTRRRVAATAAALLTSAALDAEGIDRVEIHHARENQASAGVPQLLGYARVGEIPGDPAMPGLSGIDVVWRMTARDRDRDLLEGIRVRSGGG